MRNVRAPALPRLDGWKSYEPKVTVNLDPGEVVSGTKTVEYLLLPERPGTTMIPSFELAYFDPATKAYAVAKSDPLRIEVTGTAASDKAVAAGGPGPHGAAGAAGVENVISTEIRPIRARASLNRDLGATFYRSRPFLGLLLFPPLGLVLGRFVARLRERLAQDSQRNRRRRVRQMVRQRLGAAEDHRDAGRRSAFYIEIDRVVRDVLAARLRRPVTGLRMDELRDLLLARGMPADEAGRVIAELESCDLARFAPAETGATASREQMNAALERAGELIVAIDKAPLREEAAHEARVRMARRCPPRGAGAGAAAGRRRARRSHRRSLAPRQRRLPARRLRGRGRRLRGARSPGPGLGRSLLQPRRRVLPAGQPGARDLVVRARRRARSRRRGRALQPDPGAQDRRPPRARQDRGRRPRAVLDARGRQPGARDGDLAVHRVLPGVLRRAGRAVAPPAAGRRSRARCWARPRRSWARARCSPASCSRAAPTWTASRRA